MAIFNDKVEAKDFHKMPAEYQDLVLRLLRIQADCEIGGPHIYARKWLLDAPSSDEMYQVSRIAGEEIDHFRKFNRLLEELGHSAEDSLRASRDARKVDAFKAEMPTWAHFAVFSFLIDRVGQYQLAEFKGCSYAPAERILGPIEEEEAGHVAFGYLQLRKLMQTEEGRRQAQEAINYWFPKGLDMFGHSESKRSERYVEWGIKRRTNGQARQEYLEEASAAIRDLGLEVPDPMANRQYF